MLGGIVREPEGDDVDQAAQCRVGVVGECVRPPESAELADEKVALALARTDKEIAPFELVVQGLDRKAHVSVPRLARSPLGQREGFQVERGVDVENDDLLRHRQERVVVHDVALQDHDVAPGLGLRQARPARRQRRGTPQSSPRSRAKS